MRIPVTSGVSGAYFCVNGRGVRTGHFCIICSSLPSSRTHTVWVTLKSPDSMDITLPPLPGGTMIL